jgi:phytol kinase
MIQVAPMSFDNLNLLFHKKSIIILMLIRLIVACFFVGSAIFFAEVARANKWVSGERARKIIHILIGVWGAWLPLWLGWRSIIVLGVMLFTGVLLANHLKLFKSIHSIGRSTIGEYLFPMSMVFLALFFKTPVIFAAAMLQLGVADGMAAVIGTRYGKKTVFKVFGQKKTKHGTATFFVCSSVIMFWAIYSLHPAIAGATLASVAVTLLLSVIISSVLTVSELMGIKGIDNVTVPFITAISLQLLK